MRAVERRTGAFVGILEPVLTETTEDVEVFCQEGQFLTDLVVQVPGDPRPFNFLRAQNPRAEVAYAIVARAQIGPTFEYLLLGLTPSHSLNEQRWNGSALGEQERQRAEDVTLVTAPDAQLLKHGDRTGRHASSIDVPVLQLAPIHLRDVDLRRSDRDGVGLLAVQHLQGLLRYDINPVVKMAQVAPHGSMPHGRVIPGVDRSVRDRREVIQIRQWPEVHPGPVVGYGQVVDDRMCRQGRHALLQFLDRQTGQINDRDSWLERLKLLPGQVLVEPIHGGGTADDEDLADIGLQGRRQRDRAREPQFSEHAGRVRNAARFWTKRKEHDWRAREPLAAIVSHELKC